LLCSMNFQYPKFGTAGREIGCVLAQTGSNYRARCNGGPIERANTPIRTMRRS
jgi:hypothetical protein